VWGLYEEVAVGLSRVWGFDGQGAMDGRELRTGEEGGKGEVRDYGSPFMEITNEIETRRDEVI
jgi:hypothetical protein